MVYEKMKIRIPNRYLYFCPNFFVFYLFLSSLRKSCLSWLNIGDKRQNKNRFGHGIYSLHGMDRSLDSIGTCVTKMQRGFSPISEERGFF